MMGMVPVGVNAVPASPSGAFTPYWSIRQEVARLFFGTFALEGEYHRSQQWSYVGGVMVTYRTSNDISMIVGSRPSGLPYAGGKVVLSGWGGFLQTRYFLTNFSRAGGTFAFIDGMYRRLRIHEVNHSYAFRVGRIATGIGASFTIGRFAFSSTIGGGIRLSRYEGASSFTLQSTWLHLDYSGIFPTGSLSMGIVLGSGM